MAVSAEPLVPFRRAEALTLAQAAEVAGRSTSTVRNWCCAYRIGRHVCGRWAVSKVALAMLLDADKGALQAYLGGERDGVVADYFARVGVEIPALTVP